MRKFLATMMVGVVSGNTFAFETYIVKKGDTLSQIVQKIYPEHRIYGGNGKLNKIIERNPRLKDPNVIYPNQKIVLIYTPPIEEPILATVEEVQTPEVPFTPEPVQELETKKEEENTRVISDLAPPSSMWTTWATYGAKTMQFQQSGSLVDSDLNVTMFNNFKFGTEFLYGDWGGFFKLETYKFKYASLGKVNGKSMNAFEFGGSYKWVIASLGTEENPIFRRELADIQMAKMNTLYAGVGLKTEFDLPALSLTTLKLRGMVKMPVSNGTDDSKVKISSTSGMKAQAEALLTRELYNGSKYGVHLTLGGDISYQTLKNSVKWDSTSGTAETSIFFASCGLGLSFTLK